MRQIVVTRHGAPDVLQLREGPDPVPGPGEVRIAVRAAGVNFADLLARVGLYPDAPPPPCVVGYEVAGYVDAVGAGVSTRREGDRVVALTKFGGYSESVVAPERFVYEAPRRLSDVEAGAIPVTYLTAAVGLYRMAGLEAGETVLVHNAAGGVGTAATQLARLRGATIIGTASASKHRAVLACGAHYVFDPRERDVASEVRRLTAGRGVDVVLDGVGGSSIATGYRLLAPLGRIVAIGVSGAIGRRRSLWRAARLLMQMPAFRPLGLIDHNRGVFGLNLGRLWSEQARLDPLMRLLLDQLQDGQLQPLLARTFPLEQAAAAHEFLHARLNVGKVVLTTSAT